MLNSIFLGAQPSTITMDRFVLCTLASVLLGVAIAVFHTYKNSMYSKGFIVTLSVLPLIVQSIIMVVNGNIGTGVAVAGAFSLIRFRSVQGTAKDICAIFLAMAVGLSTGMGYIFIAVSLTVCACLLEFLYSVLNLGGGRMKEKILKITVPENLEFDGMFDDTFEKYAKHYELMGTKTTDMGSLYTLHYRIMLKSAGTDKAFIDELRTKNGNLEISLNIKPESLVEL